MYLTPLSSCEITEKLSQYHPLDASLFSSFAAYELWFKQIIHELDSIREMLTIEELVKVLQLFFISSNVNSCASFFQTVTLLAC